MKTRWTNRILLGCCLCELFFPLRVIAQTNRWTSAVTGNWHDLSWSLGTLPDSNQTAFVTNFGSKAVIVNAATRDAHLGSMTVDNLYLSAPPYATNTILLNYTGIAVPFTVLHNLLVESNGVFLNLFGDLKVGTNSDSFCRINGGTINQDGGLNQFSGTCYVGSSNYGIYNLSNGTSVANNLLIGNSAGGIFNQFGGTNFVQDEMVVSGAPSSCFYHLYNGALKANDISVGVYDPGGKSYGKLFQHGGTVVVSNALSLSASYGGDGYYSLETGTLESAVTDIGSYGMGLFEQSGGSHKTGQLYVGDYYFRRSAYNLNQGNLQSQSTSLSSESDFWQGGGTNSVSNELYVGGNYHFSGGRLTSSNTMVGSSKISAGTFFQSGGTHIITNQLTVIGESIDGQFASYLLSDGTLDCGTLDLWIDCRLKQTGGNITNRNLCDLNGGLIELDHGMHYFGILAVNISSILQLSTNPCILHFASSASSIWGENSQLIIFGYQGSTNGGGLHQIYFGNSAAGLGNSQLSRIRFYSGSDGSYAKILDTGEVVPSMNPIIEAKINLSGLTLTWPTDFTFTLQSATNVNGPYMDLPGGTTPYTISPGSLPQQFFRIRYGSP